LIFSISYIQSFFPPERTKKILGKFNGLSANIIGALLGTITPFCSCSSIPLFIGFTSAGLPIGVTFSFLISSPLVDLASVLLLASIFNWKIALAYVVVGLVLAIIGGSLISKMNMEKYVESFVFQGQNATDDNFEMTFVERLEFGKTQVLDIIKRVWLYILIGVGIGAAIHNWIPESVIAAVLGQDKWYSVFLAVFSGIPMYADIFGTLPIAEALVVKGVGYDALNLAIEDAYKRLIAPSIEREIRSMLTERAEEEAIKVFAKNTKPLLLVPPVREVMVLAIDPSFRTGCKLTVLDGTGKLLDYKTIYPNAPQNKFAEAKVVLKDLIKKYGVDIIPIGNGTASRETEQLVAEVISEMDQTVHYTIVSEAGASVYSASKLATQEYPDLDVSIRGAISIGRRLQDPLAELVKIDTKHIGVGQYQHDLNQKKLDTSLTNVVEDCVNSVGVDLNIASPSLLQYVSGISSAVAKNIVAYREENGRFNSRKDIKAVKRLGDKVYEQCAGFLRIYNGKEVLDLTSVHPESYKQTYKLIEKLGYDVKTIDEHSIQEVFADIDERILAFPVKEEKKVKPKAQSFKSNNSGLKGLAALKSIQFEKPKTVNKGKERKEDIERHLKAVAEDLDLGYFTLRDIVEELKKPGRDIRDEMPQPIFRSDVLKMEDLRVDMVLTGTVRNVVDFGAFVDIGVKQDGLVHISHLSEKFVKKPMDVVSVGDQVKVRVIDIDLKKQKIALSMTGIKA